jgi:NitT/TauT family transport system substrate-binding protein
MVGLVGEQQGRRNFLTACAALSGGSLLGLPRTAAAEPPPESKLASKYEYALETLREVRFDVWRSYDPEDSMRFHANRLHEVGMIKAPPNTLIARGTDWRFLNELRRELKA